MYPGVATFVLIRPAQTFYERIKHGSYRLDTGPDGFSQSGPLRRETGFHTRDGSSDVSPAKLLIAPCPIHRAVPLRVNSNGSSCCTTTSRDIGETIGNEGRAFSMIICSTLITCMKGYSLVPCPARSPMETVPNSPTNLKALGDGGYRQTKTPIGLSQPCNCSAVNVPRK